MSNFRVTRFNHIAGNDPVNFENKQAFWKQVKLQAKLILEEAQEMFDSAEAEDIVNVLDGQLDVWVTNEYMDDLLSTTGIDVKEGRNIVCDNNDSKFTRNHIFAVESAEAQEKSGVPSKVVESSFGGGTYYTVRRIEDGKILKLIGHAKPNLKEVFTREALEYFGIEGE